MRPFCVRLRLQTTPLDAGRRLAVARARLSSAAADDGPRVAIVGTGPSGFYTAKYLIKDHPGVRVDLLDALPTPFGAAPGGAPAVGWLRSSVVPRRN